jgi:hypothetical protein
MVFPGIPKRWNNTVPATAHTKIEKRMASSYFE